MIEIISPNMLKIFQLCPKKFFYRYIKGITMPVNDEYFITGKKIHALASYYLNKENTEAMELSLSPKEKSLWEYLKQIKYFEYECVNTEFNLSVKLNNHFYGGRLDSLVKHNNKYYILDYKTGEIPADPKYDFQTMIYLLAVKAYYKADNISFVYVDIKNKNEFEIKLTPELITEYKNRLAEMSKKMDKAEFIPISKSCDNCEYKVICYDKKLSD